MKRFFDWYLVNEEGEGSIMMANVARIMAPVYGIVVAILLF